MADDWNIDPAGVQSVLTQTAGQADQFEMALSLIATNLETAATSSASGLVGNALSGFAFSKQADIQNVMTRVNNAFTGCTGAVNAYNQGQMDMAANAQASASAAPTGSFSSYSPDSTPGGPR